MLCVGFFAGVTQPANLVLIDSTEALDPRKVIVNRTITQTYEHIDRAHANHNQKSLLKQMLRHIPFRAQHFVLNIIHTTRRLACSSFMPARSLWWFCAAAGR